MVRRGLWLVWLQYSGNKFGRVASALFFEKSEREFARGRGKIFEVAFSVTECEGSTQTCCALTCPRFNWPNLRIVSGLHA